MKRILVADDDRLARKAVNAALEHQGYDVVEVADGIAAWEALRVPGAPALAVIDWMMPGFTGPELAALVAGLTPPRPYVIIVTGRADADDVVAALDAGADDYVVKPFSAAELRARVAVGLRVVGLQRDLTARIAELETARADVKLLGGLLPLWAWCRRVRSDQDYWEAIESYLKDRSDLRITHGICPECQEKFLEETGSE